ncbi:MAG: methyltransferase domain-containing protein [Bacteroidota bacterium]|nr:methyltransferase domain-containing protein [Bacteroidota bacterium]MDP4215178.1 methyltransferase domain-containing protein [Bacteroidota bacterium]MDP4244993.1 methyltransferase domain-containing protein [Bacteroidota bacterium]MDP4252677.1 methyltransferase domain-containing protein [Bacteroidota bacterium]MDP4256700.1 methyltransferase domain-containing protein [Bacteroidota bacterium]
MNDYQLLCCHENPHNGRVYFAKNNQRRWIPSGEHMKEYGFDWDLVKTYAAEQIASYELMSPLPHPRLEYRPGTMSVGEIREFIGNQVCGKGVEFGAASSPFPTALESQVEYADLFDHSLISSPYHNHHTYARHEYVKCKYLTGMEVMVGIPDRSLDFIIASHVIEHLRNPLQAMETAWTRLKPEGKLVLMVPHRDLTFDKNRDITSLEHIVLDYERPLKERDFMHFYDFYENAFVAPNPFEKAVEMFNSDASDIHYHTWNEGSFLEMVQYFSDHIRKWSDITYYPHLPNEQANEFYFILKK